MKKIFIVLLLAALSLNVYGQMVFTGQNEKFKFAISGEMSGLMTAGLADNNQNANNTGGHEPPGVYFPNLQTGDMASVGPGKNGYYNN